MSNPTASIEVFYFDTILVFTTTGKCGSASFWARLDAAGCGDKQFHEANVVVRGCLQYHQLLPKVVVSTNSRLVVIMVVQEVASHGEFQGSYHHRWFSSSCLRAAI
jgi:hypothetical protein